MSPHVKIVPFHSLDVSTGGQVKIVPFSFTWCQHRLRGGAGRKTVLLIFQPTHFIKCTMNFFIMICMKNMERKQNHFPPPCFVSMEMAAIFVSRGLTKVHITLKSLLQMYAVKSCTHIEGDDIRLSDVSLSVATLVSIAMICVTKSRTGNYDFRACARARARGFPGSTRFGRIIRFAVCAERSRDNSLRFLRKFQPG